MKRIFRIAVAALIAFSLILTECLCVSGTVITKGDLSVEEWIAAAESLNMDDYVSGTEEFLRALKNLKNAKYNYDNADNPEFSVISQLKSAWDNLKYEEKTAEPLFKGKTFSGDINVALNSWDYSTGETKYIILSEYSHFELTLSTTGSGEYGNSVDIFFTLKNGETSNRWWGGLWGSNSSVSNRTIDIEKLTQNAKIDPDSAISSIGFSLNNYGGESATFSDIYGYKQISAKYPENYESLSLAEWILAAKKLDLTKFTTGVDEFKAALEEAELQKWLLSGGNKEEFIAYMALKKAWTNLKYSEKENESLVNETSGIPSQSTGFSANLLKTVNLSEYEKFDIVMEVQKYKNPNGGLSLNLQFDNNGKVLNQWFNANNTEDIRSKTSADIISTGVNEWKILKIYGANGGYNEEITLKAIYGYKYIYAKLPANADSMDLATLLQEAMKFDTTQYTSGLEEFSEAIAAAKKLLGIEDPEPVEPTEEEKALLALKQAWLNLKYSEKETESLVNETSGIPSQGTGFSANLLKTVNLSEYEKFDIVMDVQKYKKPNGGLSLNLQFDNNGKVLTQWFNANNTEDTRSKTSADIISTGVNEWKILKIYGANGGYNEEITLKAIYGYKYIYAKLPANADSMDLATLLQEAMKFDTTQYTSGLEEFSEAIAAAKKLLGIEDPEPVEPTEEEKALLALKQAWLNLKYSEKETESLVNEKSGIPSQGTGFSANLLKTVNLSEYEKFDIVMDVQNYKNSGGGLSLNLQFANGGSTLNQWFNATKTEDTRTKTAEQIRTTGVSNWSTIKIFGANSGYTKEITLKAIYGYKFVSATLPESAENMNLSELVAAAKALDVSLYTAGVDVFNQAIKSAEAILMGTTIEELEAIENLKIAWKKLVKVEKETESLVNEVSGIPSQTTGFITTLLKTVNLSEYEKFDIVMDVQNYKNSGGGLSLNIQFANSGSTLNQWFNATKTEDTRTKTAEQIKSTGVSNWSTIKIFGANSGYTKEITLKAIYGYKYVSPEFPVGYEEFTLSDWIVAAEQLNLEEYSNTADFETALANAKELLSTKTNGFSVLSLVKMIFSANDIKITKEDVQNNANTAPNNTSEIVQRKNDYYNKLSSALNELKTAWKGLRTKEMYLIAIPKNAIKNTDEDEVPSEFGNYAVYENVGITSKFNYQLVDGKVDFVGIDRIEIYLRAATLKDGKYKTPETTSFLLQINSAENGRKDIWSAVPTGANYGKAAFNTSSQKNLQPYTEIGSDPVTILDFMSGYDTKNSLVCDTLTLGGIYAIKYHTVPFPKGALLETSGADVSELSALVEHANKFNESDFSMATWKPFKKALAQAKAVIYDITAPQGTVDAAKEKLLSAWGELIYYQRVPLYDVAENIEWGLEIADNLAYPQYVSVSDKTLPVGITSYAKLTNVPSKWHKLCFRQMTNSDTKNFDFIELYTRYDTTLNRGDSGCFYFQINYNYQVWKGFPSSNTNGKWQQLLIDLDEFTAQKDKTKKFVDASGKIGSFSVSLTGGASGNFDISSANLIKCIKVEAGKDPVTEEIGTSISVIGEDFNNDVFDLRYESADDGEEFELPKENTVSKPQEVKKENNITVIILISAVAAFVVFAAVTGIVIWRRKVK